MLSEGKKENENQQTDFSLHCHLLLFEKLAQPDKRSGEAASASFAKLFDKAYWITGVWECPQ